MVAEVEVDRRRSRTNRERNRRRIFFLWSCPVRKEKSLKWLVPVPGRGREEAEEIRLF
jgi:hypothetical protein